MRQLLLIILAPVLMSAKAPPGTLEVEIQNLRNARGMIHACLTSNIAFFPDCSADPASLKHSATAGDPEITFAGFAPGRYALTIIHDENANRKLDTFLGIPREGFGFSRNPKVRFGAPKFRQVDIELGSGLARQTVRMQYLL